MKTIIVLLFASFTFNIAAYAQTKEAFKNATPEQRAQWLTDTMQTSLSLNTEQYSKVFSINLAFAQKAQPVMQSDDSKILKFRQVKDLQDKREEDLEAVLTKDQYKLYEENKDEMIGNMKEKYKSRK